MKLPSKLLKHTVLVTGAMLLWLGCGSPPSSRDEEPYAYRTGGARLPTVDAGQAATGVAEPAVEVDADLGATPSSIAANEVEGALVLSALASLLSSMTANGDTLDVTQTPEAVTAAIAASAGPRICVRSTLTYLTGTAYLILDFGPGCAAFGAAAMMSGTILAAVTTSTSGAPWLSVAFTLSGVSINGHPLDGYAALSTDGTTDSFTSRVAVNGIGTIAFTGTAAADESGMTLDGAGSWANASRPAAVTSQNGWNCGSSASSAFGIHGLHKAAASCYADDGSIFVTRPYACTRAIGNAALERTSLVAIASATFSRTTPATGAVAVALTGRSWLDAGAATTVTLPTNVCPSQ